MKHTKIFRLKISWYAKRPPSPKSVLSWESSENAGDLVLETERARAR